jgi:hypothetical protein
MAVGEKTVQPAAPVALASHHFADAQGRSCAGCLHDARIQMR